MPTSTWQELRSHAVAVSAGLPPPMLHGVSVLQMSTFVIGPVLAGPKFGTASGSLVVGVGLDFGLVLGDVLGDVVAPGEWVAVAVPDPPRWARMKLPVPSSSTRITAMIAGISHRGRSDGPEGLRAAVGLRAGIGAGARNGFGAGATGASAAAKGAAAAATGSVGVGVSDGGL